MARSFVWVALAIASVGQAAHAQSIVAADDLRTGEMRVMAGISVPIGGARQKSDRQPKFDLSIAQRVRQAEDVLAAHPLASLQHSQWRKSSVSLTFENNPQLLLNEMPVARFGNALHADEGEKKGGGGTTALYVVGGVLLLGVAGAVAVTTDARDAVSDAIGPAD